MSGGHPGADGTAGAGYTPTHEGVQLLGAGAIRELASAVGVNPTKQLGQNFVIDGNTVRRIVATAGVGADDVVVEVGPGLGSLTLALLEHVDSVTAVEIDPVLAEALPGTVERFAPSRAHALRLVQADAMRVTELPQPQPTALVANLPYNVSVPVLLNFLERFPTLKRVLVMVQLEVAERLSAAPGSKVYGVPSVKTAWYGTARLAGTVGKNVFWPAPRVESGLVEVVRHKPASTDVPRSEVFACIDAAFAQRRKALRGALATWAGGMASSEAFLRAAGIDPTTRGERLTIEDFTRIAQTKIAAQ
ncbi:16S rRNA (adenine(1518)-N(6)/adenine(1519)-N(6))-dimethyltransferase RsmA [Dermatophilus congolensis]|uniref:16S rRNA (adenine(1518)-N(6)/adenine(1519)-N(6))- dimethyltransferase RsmA n=1 Tax=Dermatophilus congolensis TaxID=1863 RepID=UPI001AB031FE|nr:16S rRNA (adenine(1518)-N(6)/adenine(1519)-N(6))-dimethyltransferase RsmA [Dermatophilus congolensis]MBO3147797.1 16S rRNA (adenine(1518)-N(6)/adenine(1519)-N(6))-dimethyltransferase RsmA [Dermatophilus congolensis]